ncbi:hypothetical protein M427DRAFT_52543 [Gonapodya prolifera JEL478]|uniref:RCC1/BLIP-II protein n=1 Tax=Gonapodya prolifera (strain JEL478) TaxID=1344416 RepID=A0A139AUA6_GONPJ|nr:hypothetical protein M427DRAFT_52543 [Gonapodya prolifera JEL478]|eukprot:KXS20320.1 hypothetical protein M427DRAFT_52543 [Gonapodya prolifera JEL478]
MSGLVAGPHHALLLPKSKNEAPLALRLGAVGGLHGQLGDGGVVSGPFNPQTEDPREIEALAGVDLPRCAAGGLFSVWSDNNGELYASGKHSLGTARKQAWWEGRSHGRDEKVAQDEDQSDATIPCLVRGPLDEPVDLIACGEHMTAVVLASDRKENKARVWWKGMGMEMERNTSQNEGTWQPVDLGKERGAVSGISCGDGTGWHVVVRVIKET